MSQPTIHKTDTDGRAISDDGRFVWDGAAWVSRLHREEPTEREALYIGWHEFVLSHRRRDPDAAWIGAAAAIEAINHGVPQAEIQTRALAAARSRCSRPDARVTKQMARARQLVGEQDLGGASAIYEAALATDPTFTDAIYGLARVQMRLDRYGLATALFERYEELMPGDFRPAFNAGSCHISNKEPRAAVRTFVTALRICPLDEELRIRGALAQAHVQAQQYREAKETVGQLVFDGRRGTSTLVKCLLWGATADYYLGKRDEAKGTIDSIWHANLTDEDLIQARHQLATGEAVTMFQELAEATDVWS